VYLNLSSCFLSTKFETVVNVELELLKIKKSESERLISYFGRMDALVYELGVYGQAWNDQKRKLHAILHIGDRWQPVAQMVGNPEDITYTQFKSELLRRERIWMSGGNIPGNEAATLMTGRKGSEAAASFFTMKRGSQNDKGPLACFKCGKIGHVKT
jgi:hypothetical protein